MAMYEKQQQLVDQVTDQMSICAKVLGELNEVESEKKLRDRIQNIAQGIFQVMFTGTFNAGKSTILNALMHSEKLATGNLPETAVITKIIFKSEDECAIIYKKELDDKGQPKTIVMKDLAQFFKEYHVDREDTEKFRKIVDHVVIHQKGSGIAGSMVQLVDSPGTRASAADDEVALSYAEKADALVFMISAMEPLDKNDKEYIAKHFAGKQKENVFFVVNKINLLNSDADLEKLKDYVQSELKSVFTDKKGVFNKKLFDERVFYVDAYGAMNTRLGRETPITRNFKVMVPEEQTHMPEFESGLAAYLGAGDRDKKALAAYRSQMADFYMIAEESKRKQLELLAKGKDEIEAELASFRKKKEKYEREIKDIENDIETARLDILRDARDTYDSYVESVESGWEEFFEDKSSEMGIHVLRLLGAKAGSVLTFWKDSGIREQELKQKTDEATKEFQAGIREYMNLKTADMKLLFTSKLRARLNKLDADMQRHSENLEKMDATINIDEVVETILRENNVKIPVGEENNSKLGQAFIAVMLADPEHIIDAGTGQLSSLDFLINVIATNIIDVIIASVMAVILGNVVGIIFFVIWKLVKASTHSDDFTKKMIANTMEIIVGGGTDKDGNPIPGMRKEGRRDYISETEQQMRGAFLRSKSIITEGIRDSLSGTERKLSNAYKTLADKNNTYEQEKARMDKLVSTFAKAISEMSVLTTGEALDAEGIARLSSATK